MATKWQVVEISGDFPNEVEVVVASDLTREQASAQARAARKSTKLADGTDCVERVQL